MAAKCLQILGKSAKVGNQAGEENPLLSKGKTRDISLELSEEMAGYELIKLLYFRYPQRMRRLKQMQGPLDGSFNC
jgi:hypothetical protein